MVLFFTCGVMSTAAVTAALPNSIRPIFNNSTKLKSLSCIPLAGMPSFVVLRFHPCPVIGERLKGCFWMFTLPVCELSCVPFLKAMLTQWVRPLPPSAHEAMLYCADARTTGFSPIKISTVLLQGMNDDEVEDLLDYCEENGSFCD